METNSISVNKKISIEAPVFIIFASFLGYVSPLYEDAANWCDGKVPSPYMQHILMIEAQCIHKQMMEDYTREEILFYYESYHILFIKPYEDKLQSLLYRDSDDDEI